MSAWSPPMSAVNTAPETRARSFGEIAAGLKPKKIFRSGEPVWRNSYSEGQIENRVWRPIAGGTVRAASRYRGAVLKAAREMERRTRRTLQAERKGVRNGLIGAIGLEVLEALYHLVDFASGRLEPAVATLAEMTGHCYSAVHAALGRLRRAGFIHWMRRSRPLDRKGEAGPQVEQIPNAYALLLPPEIEKMVRHQLREAPLSADEEWRRAERKAEWEGMLASVSAAEFLKATWDGDSRTGETLARIAEALDAQEARWKGSSANRREREKPGASDL